MLEDYLLNKLWKYLLMIFLHIESCHSIDSTWKTGMYPMPDDMRKMGTTVEHLLLGQAKNDLYLVVR